MGFQVFTSWLTSIGSILLGKTSNPKLQLGVTRLQKRQLDPVIIAQILPSLF